MFRRTRQSRRSVSASEGFYRPLALRLLRDQDLVRRFFPAAKRPRYVDKPVRWAGVRVFKTRRQALDSRSSSPRRPPLNDRWSPLKVLALPRQMLVCLRRKARREVLFAFGRSGRHGAGGAYHRTSNSQFSCR